MLSLHDEQQSLFKQKTTYFFIQLNQEKQSHAVRKKQANSHLEFTEVQSGRPSSDASSKLKNELKAMIDSAPKDEKALIRCIDSLKEKLQSMKASPKRNPPPETLFVLNRHKTPYKEKQRYKTNVDDTSRKVVSKSLNFTPKHSLAPSLKNLQQLRNEIKKQKQAQKRLPTENQRFRYQEYSQENSPSRVNQNRKRLKYSSETKMRSNTEEIIKSKKYPGRYYQHFSPRKIELEDETNPFSRKAISAQKVEQVDNNLVEKQEELLIKDNNEKIGDLSTIMKQKETLNFLGESCVAIKQELSPQKVVSHPSKLLQFVDWRTRELKNVLSGSKQKKRKTGLDKLSKIFPKGFFV